MFFFSITVISENEATYSNDNQSESDHIATTCNLVILSGNVTYKICVSPSGEAHSVSRQIKASVERKVGEV